MSYSHPLWRSMRTLKGNQRACVLTEPLWSVPNNLFVPFASLYMSAIGLQDSQIGLLASIGIAVQLVWGLLSGAVTDKLGRRATMLLFGLLSWTVPCILWACARSFPYFLLAVLFNGMWRVTGNCFSCMIVEDQDTSQLVNVFTILNLMGLLAGFLSPITGLFIERYTLVPVLRAVYWGSMALMTIKYILQYAMVKESEVGERRIRECKHFTVFSLTFGGWRSFQHILCERRLLLCILLASALTCYNTVQEIFWPLFVSSAYNISDSLIAAFPMVRAVVTLSTFLLVTPHVKTTSLSAPVFVALASHGLGLLCLVVFLPLNGGIPVVVLSACCDAFALAILSPLMDSIMSLVIPAEHRARINSMIIAFILLLSLPAGWLGGQLAQLNRALPFGMNFALLLLAGIAAFYITHALSSDHR